MIVKDVIERSNFHGSHRYSVDHRKLYEITRKDFYSLPRCEEIVESLTGTAYFTNSDLVREHCQVKVAKGDREKAAFAPPGGLF